MLRPISIPTVIKRNPDSLIFLMNFSFSNIGSTVRGFLNSGHKRSVAAKKNIAWLFVVKGLHIAINMALVPITIKYIDTMQYGIWLTLSSVVGWFAFFDIGLSNGLRNKFAEAKAVGDLKLARKYVSATYAALFMVFSLAWLIFIVVNQFVDWTRVLNAPEDMQETLSKLALVVFSFFFLKMLVKTLRFIIIANQEPAKASFLELLGQILALVIIIILVRTTEGSILKLGIVLGICPVLVFIVASIWYFRNSYRDYAPSLRLINLKYGKEILNIGVKFFVIQISTMVIYQTNNLIIAQIGGPEDVTVYNVAFKYMSVALMGLTIIITPYWSAITEAMTKGDFNWISKTVKRLRQVFFFIFFIIGVMLVFSGFIYRLWVGDAVQIPFSITLVNAVYILFLCWALLHTSIVNGTGKIHIQLMTYSFGMLFHIPTAVYLGRMYGTVGVLISAIFFCAIIGFVSYIQVNKIIHQTATGWWNRS